MKHFFTQTWQILKESKTNFQQGEPIVYSAAIAFFTIFSLPAILIFLSLLGSFFFSEAAVQDEIVAQVEELVSKEAGEQASTVLSNVTNIPVGFWSILIGVVVMIKSSTIIFFIIQKALNSVWQVKVKKNVKYWDLLKHRLLTLLMVASLGFFFMASIVLDIFLDIYSQQLQDLFEQYLGPAVKTINTVFNIILMLIFFTAAHRVLPDAKVDWRDALAGGIITSFLFLIGKEVISYILGSVKVVGIYATAGSLVVLLLWVFYSAIIMMLGAEVTKAYASHYNHKVEPSDIAVKYERVKEKEV